MNSIDTRPPFFPHSKTAQDVKTNRSKALARNTFERAQELDNNTSRDAKVAIGDQIKDFSRIKRAVDNSAPTDNSAKIADLKARIQAGTYEVDYDGLADKMLASEY